MRVHVGPWAWYLVPASVVMFVIAAGATVARPARWDDCITFVCGAGMGLGFLALLWNMTVVLLPDGSVRQGRRRVPPHGVLRVCVIGELWDQPVRVVLVTSEDTRRDLDPVLFCLTHRDALRHARRLADALGAPVDDTRRPALVEPSDYRGRRRAG